MTATCTGVTSNQGSGAPGSSFGTNGYGTGTETNVTLTVAAGATLQGTFAGLSLQSGTLINSGKVYGTSPIFGIGASAFGTLTVINNAGAVISGPIAGLDAQTLNLTNSGDVGGIIFGVGATNLTLVNTASGNISGPIAIAAGGVGGSASVYNAGLIDGSIGFAGTNNTLTLAPSSVIRGYVFGGGSDTLQLGGSGTGTFYVSQLSASGRYQGFATLNKVESSTWTLVGTSPFTGSINVNAGALNVAGSVADASLLTINSGGLVSGTGAVGNTNVMNGGTFAPGSGVAGTSMRVSGNLTFQSGAIYQVQVSPSAASSANVTGTATLGGAAVSAVFSAGSYIQKSYSILTAGGGVSGSFAPAVTTNLPFFSTRLSYDTNDVYLNVTPNLSGGQNAQAVGNALANYFNTSGGLPAIYGFLTPSGLTQASGELATGSQQTTFNAMGQFMGLLTAPFMQRSGTPGSSSATGFAEEDVGNDAASKHPDAFAMFTKARPVPFIQRWSVWAAGFGGSQSTDGNAVVGSNNTTSSIYGTAVGADYLFSPNTLAGFALAGGGTNFNVNGLGAGRSDLFQAGVYMRHTQGPAYVSAALAYGWQDITTNRTVTVGGIDQLHAEFNANAYSGRAESGYRIVAPWTGGVGITPYAAGQFTTFDLPAYAENIVSGTRAFALAYTAKDVTDTRSELGLRSDKSFALQDSVLTLRARVAWAHDFNPDRSVAATFQALPGASFVVNGAAQASDSALTTVSGEVKWMNGWSAMGVFEGEFSNVTTSYAGKAVARYAW